MSMRKIGALLVVWFIASVLCAVWIWTNLSVAHTGLWLDRVFGLFVTVLLLGRVESLAQLVLRWRQRQLVVTALILFFVLSLLAFLPEIIAQSIDCSQARNLGQSPLSPSPLACVVRASWAWGGIAMLTAAALRAAGCIVAPVLVRQFIMRFAGGPLGKIRRRHLLVYARVLAIVVVFVIAVGWGPYFASTSRVSGDGWFRSGSVELPLLQTLALDQRTGALYAGTAKGVFLSRDGGVSWQPASTGLTEGLVSSMAVDQRDGTVFVGLVEGVFESPDGGANWTRTSISDVEVLVTAQGPGRALLLAGLLAGDVGQAIDHQDSERVGSSWPRDTELTSAALDANRSLLYLGAQRGILILAENRGVWSVTGHALRDVPIESLLVNSRDGSVYAGTRGLGVYHSTNGGVDWATGMVLPDDVVVSALLLDEDSGVLYAGGRSEVFLSRDGGMTWQSPSISTIDSRVLVLLRDRERSTLYAGTEGGVFVSLDGGSTWQPPRPNLRGTTVAALASGQAGSIYAGTFGRGVVRSTYLATGWQTVTAGLVGTNVQALLLDDRSGYLYAATEDGLLHSVDGGRSWQTANTGLGDASVVSLLFDENIDALIAGTWGKGIFRSTDHAGSWQRVTPEEFAIPITALVVDRVIGDLYAGTLGAGLLRSKDHGRSWQPASSTKPLDKVLALVVDEKNHVVIAGTESGAYRSTNGGASWQGTGTTLLDAPVRAFALDEQAMALYAAFDDLIARSDDSGLTWQTIGSPRHETLVQSLATDQEGDGAATLYAGTRDGLYRSPDGGMTWQSADGDSAAVFAWTGALALDHGAQVFAATSSWLSLPTSSKTVSSVQSNILNRAFDDPHWQALIEPLDNIAVQGLGVEPKTNTLYASGTGGVFSYDPVAGNWLPVAVDGPPCTLSGLFRLESQHGVASRGPDGKLIWAVWGGGVCWARVAAALDLSQAALRPQPNGSAQLYVIADGEFMRADLNAGYRRLPIFYLVLRATMDKAATWVSSNSPQAALGIIWFLVLLLPPVVIAVPIIHGLLRLRNLPKDDRGHRVPVAVALQEWEPLVRDRLMRFGEVASHELDTVPSPYRRLVVRHFANSYGGELGLVVRRGRIQLLNQDALRCWRAAWTTVGRELDTRAELTATARDALQKMATVLCQLLGLRFQEGAVQEYGAMRAYSVEGQALGLKTPEHFPLVFTADERPDEGTVHRLVEMLGIMHEQRFFAFVVPLECTNREIDAAAELRRAINVLPYAHDFVILRNIDVEELIVARHPDKVLSQRFYPQMDLKIVSPFVYTGPVPETMFFGREAEIKQLLGKGDTLDYAIVGNRQVGKTSLLKRLRTLMESSTDLHPLWVDCQSISNTAKFLEAFPNRTQIMLDRPTPEGLIDALTRARQQRGCPIVLLMDEVDALLSHEKKYDEPLVSAWRTLAQNDVCHFVFCGSRGLAGRLRDGTSKFLNFGAEIRLGHLSPNEARLVLARPMEKLGVALEDEDVFLDRVVDLTSGHPNLIQYIGAQLVDTVNQRRQRRIMLDDLTALETSKDFADHFRSVVWGALEPLECLILLLMPPDGCSEREIRSLLAARGVSVASNRLGATLQMLEVLSILKQEELGGSWTFVPRRLPYILQRYDVELLSEGFVDELERQRMQPSV